MMPRMPVLTIGLTGFNAASSNCLALTVLGYLSVVVDFTVHV